MKKFITAVLLLSTVFFSCNQAVNGEYATVVLDLGGSASGARAIGQNGLPFLKDTHITIEAVGRVGGTFVKEFAPGEAGNIALRFIAGDTVRLRVKASNASGIWSGSTTFTVEEGTNAVAVKLNKIISGAQALTFSLTKSASNETLDVYVGNKNICSKTEPDVSAPSFCRDAKGRIFVAYCYNNGSGALDLIRYDSEGNNPTTLIPGQQSGSVWHLASDLATGKVYVLRYDKTLYEVGETGAYTSWRNTTISGFAEIDSFAVHDRQLFVLGKKTGAGEVTKLYVYDINMQLPANQIDNEKANNIGAPPSGISNYQYTDMFVTDDAVYLLRSDYAAVPDQYGKVYSKGALIKYDYDKAEKKIDDREEFGKSDKDDESVIVPTGASCFYGPLKFIGFDDDVLYIADDGVTFEYFNKAPRISANKNRIASFNTATESLSFTDTSATWAKEEKILPRKTLLWKARTEENNTTVFDYYAVERANASLGVQPNLLSLSNTDYYTDIFCFDQDGNLYLVKKGRSDYEVVRYETTANGGYDFDHPLTPSPNPFSTDKITAIAVDASGTIEHGGYRYNALYYCYEYAPNNYKIKRIRWQTTQKFSTAATDSSWTEIPESSPVPLAANKDGLFVATNGTSGFSIKKFKYDGSLDGDIQSHDDVGTINALQIADGVLYGISTKQEIGSDPAFFNMSGKLLKIGETENFGGEEVFYYDMNNASNGDFTPYRFIAVKPKKLVIASDGAYGLEDKTSYNKNRVLIFTLDDSGDKVGDHPDLLIPDTRITFSKELRYNVDCGQFDWK